MLTEPELGEFLPRLDRMPGALNENPEVKLEL